MAEGLPRRLIFHDLVGADREPNPEEDAWLTALARETNAADVVVGVAASCAGHEHEPIIRRDMDGSWRAGRYVGELRRGDRILEIRPRLGIETIASWASAALGVRVVPRSAEHRGTSALIAELLAAVWRSAVVEAVRHGPPGLRANRQHRGTYARGRLDIRGTLKLRRRRRPHLASVDRPRLIDNPVSRALVLADRVLDRRLSSRTGWRGERLEEMMPRLRGAVGARPRLPTHRELERVRYTPITLPFKRAAELSWEIARNRGLRTTASGEESAGLLIDVAELWELFLVHCAKRACGSGVVTHGTRLREAQNLLESITRSGATLGRMYPDLLVGAVTRPTAVVDAKYKPLVDPRGVDREDLYQLTSYLAIHLGTPKPAGLLAYPRFDEEGEAAKAESSGPWRSPQGHVVRFERLPLIEGECVEALRALVDIRNP